MIKTPTFPPLKLVCLSVLLANCHLAQANYWDEQVCGFNINGSGLSPGETFSVSTSVSALRDATSTIPIDFYYSLSPNIIPTSRLLGSDSATVYFGSDTGQFCSGTVQTTMTLPTTSSGMDCFIGTGGYILAKVGDDINAKTFALNTDNARTIPTISDFSPASGHVGSIVHIKGTLFNQDTTAVYINDLPAARIVLNGDGEEGEDELIALVPDGANTDYIEVENFDGNYKLCSTTSGRSASQFTVTATPNYCNSGASYDGYGKIAYVASKDNTYDGISSPACPNYTDNTDDFTITSQGVDAEAYQVQFGTCGQPDYARLFKVYADWNMDSDFDDPAEYILASDVSSDQLYNLTIPVPDFASIGTTRLRLVNALYYSGSVESHDDVASCGYYPFGETQDYVLDITPANGVLTAEIKGRVDNVNTLPVTTEQVIDLINNDKNLSTADKQNFIDKYIDKLPGLTFSYPKGQKQQ